MHRKHLEQCLAVADIQCIAVTIKSHAKGSAKSCPKDRCSLVYSRCKWWEGGEVAAFITGANSQHCTGDHPSELQMLSRPLPRLRPFMPPTSLGSKSRPHSSLVLVVLHSPQWSHLQNKDCENFFRAESKAVSGQCLQCVAGGCERDVAGRKGPWILSYWGKP